jgi:hypothetical protein
LIADELADELRRKADAWNRGVYEREALAAPVREPPTPEEIAAVEAKVADPADPRQTDAVGP